jgi:hypothetical protein
LKDLAEVDTKLVRLTKKLKGKIVTNDYNLNKVCELQGVPVLNINELANAVKPVVLPGEEMAVQVIKDGKEAGQGVAYLDDGTMIVVENGRRYIGDKLEVVVTSVLQTAAGRMIFAKPKVAWIISVQQGGEVSGSGEVAVVIPAAGKGKRMGAPLNKQYLKLEGRPLLAYTLDVFLSLEPGR